MRHLDYADTSGTGNVVDDLGERGREMFTLLHAAAGVQWQASLMMLRTSVPGSASFSELFPAFEVYITRTICPTHPIPLRPPPP